MSQWEIPKKQLSHTRVREDGGPQNGPLQETDEVRPPQSQGSLLQTQAQVYPEVQQPERITTRSSVAPATTTGPQKNPAGVAQRPQPSPNIGVSSPIASADGSRQEDNPDELSPVRLVEARKELTQAKRWFTGVKKKVFTYSDEEMRELSEQQLVDLRRQTESAFGRLATIYERTRGLTEKREEIEKLEDGFA